MNGSALNAIIGTSPAITNLRALILALAPSKLPVLIEGPTGAGKELVAAAIHEQSGRLGDFVPFNVCAIGDSMFEDALFGHVRGAFTGAAFESKGFLREADRGTAFFDEVSGLPLAQQAKLLRAIERGEFRPIGAKCDVLSAFRTIAATNEPVSSLVAAGRLRVDLAHRLSGAVVVVPPLAARMEDIPLLAHHFLERAGLSSAIDRAALDVLGGHDWPGNVRELRNVVECAAVLGGVSAASVAAVISQRHNGDTAALAARHNHLRAALEANEWNAESAARALGVHRATVYRWMKEARLLARM